MRVMRTHFLTASHKMHIFVKELALTNNTPAGGPQKLPLITMHV